MKTEWIKLRYGSPDGEVVKEIWAQTFVQELPQIDREMEDAIAKIHTPQITCDLVDRQSTKPEISKQNDKCDRTTEGGC